MSYTADHTGFYRGPVPFSPLIQEGDQPLTSWSNTVALHLPAAPTEELNWECAQQLAAEIQASGRLILWELDLGLSSLIWRREEGSLFEELSLAVDQFCQHLLPPFLEVTLGVSLYQGALPGEAQFPRAWWEEEGQGPYPLFCLGLFSDLLHRLVSLLPSDLLPFAFFDVRSLPAARGVLHGRFEHLVLGLKGAQGAHPGICWEEGDPAPGYRGSQERPTHRTPSASAILLPEEPFELGPVLARFSTFRLIAAHKLTEEWDGIDVLWIPSRALVSAQTRRKLQGFVAAGGEILYCDEES